VLVISLELTHTTARTDTLGALPNPRPKFIGIRTDGRNGGAQVCGSADGELAGAADVADLR